ncbi:MAG: hypothetical protein HHAS10_09690 [Candidatus Altimarinota bacterium]
MNRYLALFLFFVSPIILLSSCTGIGFKSGKVSWSDAQNSSTTYSSKIGGLFKKALDDPHTKQIAERMYTDYSAGIITESFFYTALTYLNDKPSLPSFLENYKKNKGVFGEESSDTASDYIGGYIFAYAGVKTSECTEYTNALSGTFVGKRIHEGCIDSTLLYNVLGEKNEKTIDIFKKSGDLKINESLFRSIAKGETKDCGSCSVIIEGADREKTFGEISNLQKSDLKGKTVNFSLKNFNILALKSEIKPNMSDREKFDLTYDSFLLYNAIYKSDTSTCKKLLNETLSSTCIKYIEKDRTQKQEYTNYIEPYIIYSYLYEL